MPSNKRASGFVIFRKFNGPVEYLLLQRAKGEHHWAPPKGKADHGESDMETAIREVSEETGYTAADLKIYADARTEVTYIAKKKPKTIVYWLAELINKNKEVKLSDEHQDYKWVPIQEACTLPAFKEMEDALKNFDKYVSEKIYKS